MEYEGTSTAFIKDYNDTFLPTVIALTNTNGGVIYLGVSGDWVVTGVRSPEAVIELAKGMVAEMIFPEMGEFVKFETQTEDTEEGEATLVAVHVQKGISCPYFLKEKGMRPEGVFIRHEQYTVPAGEADILRMIAETGGASYEDIRTTNQALTFAYFSERLKDISIKLGRDEMMMMHIMRSDGTFSILGELMSDQCAHSIKAAAFEGTGKSVFLEKQEFTGSLLSQYRSAFEFVGKYSNSWERFPQLAVKEAMINAMVHRDYSFSGSTLVNIYSDRMEIVSYGGLVEGVNMEDVHMGVSIHRNMNLTGIFRRFGLVDSHGTGISKIMESYEGCERTANIDVSQNVFRYVLPVVVRIGKSEGVMPELSDSERQAMEIFRTKGTVVRSDIEEGLSLSQTASIELLKKLITKNLIIKTGSGKKTEYRAVEDI
ncbi:MAG: hypothetical protein GX061_04000 [Eubacteriaceae bacterium]|nr:hypothetical protein [Eubacteriaceae bacterium]